MRGPRYMTGLLLVFRFVEMTNIKQRHNKNLEWLKYRDVSWLMPHIDVEFALGRLGLRVERRIGHDIVSFCPDHHIFTGHESSHPKWAVDTETGKTNCLTEGRGSNLVFTVCRVLKCEPKEAERFLTGKDENLDVSSFRFRTDKIRDQGEEERPFVMGLDAIAQDMENCSLSGAGYQFFIHPPGKKYPTNITVETLKHYQVFERTWGYYANRIIIPFVLRGFIEGFVAIDILGKKEWMRKHLTKTEDDYRKVLYPMNFRSGKFLFGFDDCEKNAAFVVVVEGPREVMKLWQEGFPNAVAILGSHLTDDHNLLLSELNPGRVVLMFDGDDAGVATTHRVAEKLSRNFPGEKVQKCFVMRGKDPKNLCHEEFASLIEK